PHRVSTALCLASASCGVRKTWICRNCSASVESVTLRGSYLTPKSSLLGRMFRIFLFTLSRRHRVGDCLPSSIPHRYKLSLSLQSLQRVVNHSHRVRIGMESKSSISQSSLKFDRRHRNLGSAENFPDRITDAHRSSAKKMFPIAPSGKLPQERT